MIACVLTMFPLDNIDWDEYTPDVFFLISLMFIKFTLNSFCNYSNDLNPQ